ncbi:MAG: hypothetical protein LBT43_09235 [Prevotella sp.]|nr:hypothetical protein [Prevotella sp.]
MREFEKSMNFKGVYIEDVNNEGLLMRYSEVEFVADKLKREKVDAIFIPHCNFGQEEAIAKLAKEMGKIPVLIWGPRDMAPNGLDWRPTDSQCGMFASTKVLSRYGVTFSYIENCTMDSKVFEDEFAKFLAVADTVKAFYHTRIAVISTRPKEFLSVIVNEGELLEKFGIELVPAEGTIIVEMVKKQLAENQKGIEELLKSINEAGIDTSRLGEKQYAMAAIELALMEFASVNQCNAISCECWSLFNINFGVGVCFILGDLNDRGIPAACENDINAAIMSVMAIAARRYQTSSYVADLTIRHPTNEKAELLWHCGPFAKKLIKKGEKGYISERGQGFYEIQHGEHTVLRFDSANGKYYMFVGKGHGVDGPLTNGNYVWLETDNWVHWEKKFIFGPYIHHVVGIPGDVVSIMREACRYLGVYFDSAESDRFVYNLS